MPLFISLRAVAALGCTLILAPPIAHRLTHPDLVHYVPIATQDARAAGQDGYEPYPNFPHIEVVQEQNGQVVIDKSLADLITDLKLRDLVKSGAFTVLEPRNFTPRPGEATRQGTEITLPFAMSLKQTQGGPMRGTLNLKGILTMQTDGTQVRAKITEYDDSQPIERVGRMYWFHETDDLHFAEAIAPPLLIHWLTTEPGRLDRLRNSPVVGNPTRP